MIQIIVTVAIQSDLT